MVIHSRFKDYKVMPENGMGFLYELAKLPNAGYVVDQRVYHLYGRYFHGIPEERLILVEADERGKDIGTALEICERMTEIPQKRNACLVSVGGGIIQDITGFVANILYRGIRWVFVPTTLLACCDSCIGGKTSLNYKNYKNLLGTFYPPDEIHICPDFFETLTERDFESGLGEVVKFSIMAGGPGLREIEQNIDRLLGRDGDALHQFIEKSLRFKKGFIEKDEFDRGERVKLNFAHTFGHAVEAVTKYEIPHGTAVAIGMVMADYLSVKRGLLDAETGRRAEDVLLKVIHIHVCLTDYPTEAFVAAIRKDKKQTDGNLAAVLMTDTATDLRIVHDIQVEEVAEALGYFQELYDKYKNSLGNS